MSETLYRKYRPKNFKEVIGQTHIVRTLVNSILHDRIGHAYLFTGPRGTGKTSIARIFAKSINCLDLKDGRTCEKCAACQAITSGKSLDIIEIDAASNTGVDNIRELRETVNLATASLKYKVYIIDEVHMLSSGAFNALLKTLEEPPAHVVFILATTEIHKVPETIISRCQRFDFARLPLPDIIEKLTLIAKNEQVEIEKAALEMIAISAEGGMRDAESLLGQIISLEDKNITLKEVEDILGTAGQDAAKNIARLIMEKRSTEAITMINDLLDEGYDLQIFNKSLVNYLRQLMLIRIDAGLKKHFSLELSEGQLKELEDTAGKTDLPAILRAINLFMDAQKKIASSILPQLPLEIAVIRATYTFPAKKEDYVEETRSHSPAGEVKTTKKESAPERSESRAADVSEELRDEPEPVDRSAQGNSTRLDLDIARMSWKKLLTDIRPYNHSLSALLCNCQPVKAEGNLLTLATPYEFYRDRLNDAKNRLTVEQVFSKILGTKLKIEIIIDKSLIPAPEAAPQCEEKPSEQDSLLTDAMDIMGGKIVEE